MPTCGPFLILSLSRALGTPREGKGYVANLPTCGPLLICSPARKRWGPPKQQGVYSQFVTTFDFVAHSEVLGTPQTARFM